MSARGKPQKISEVLFADATVTRLEMNATLPAKFQRMLRKLQLRKRVKGKRVGVKMHYGHSLGYSTIHPVFVRALIDALKRAEAAHVVVMDNKPEDGVLRGYTPDILGCNVVSTFGQAGKYLYRQRIGFKGLDFVEYGGEAVDCDFFVCLSHVKGHGSCGFGGALKNIAMGVIPWPSRLKIHKLEGGIVHDAELCNECQKCVKNCPNKAISFDKDHKRVVFFHHCTYCQHCVLICEQGALRMGGRKFEDFCKGMALVTAGFLKKFDPENLLFINVLTDITVFCDCWGMTTPSLVPDIGILASEDIVAIDTASLDLIKTENLLPNGLPKKGRKLLDIEGHLFERIHNKNPYLMVNRLQELHGGSREYVVREVR